MNSATTILLVEDDPAISMIIRETLIGECGHFASVGSIAERNAWLADHHPDLVITDVVLPDGDGIDSLRVDSGTPVIVLSAQNTLDTAVRATGIGSYDYLPKPFDLTEMIGTIGRALSEPRKLAAQPEETTEGMPLVGRSAAMQEIYRVLARLMQTDLTLMITGESGTGKELVARALHDYGKRRNGPFVAINMAAIPRDLIESELFGHEKGAFTGAQNKSTGRFEQAEGGTLFLDEIGDMPMDAQTRLLRVLQQGEYTTVGGRTPIKTDVRIVAATNKDLKILINQGLFREDLYYRLNVVPLRLPALRDRAEDVPDLVRHFVRHAVGEGLDAKRFDGEALELLKAYPWPGNVRELENVVRRVMALYPQDVITREIIDNELRIESPEPTSPQGSTSMGPATIAQSVEENMRRYFAGFGEDLPPSGLYQRVLEEVEYPLILAALTATRGNQIKAADLLGLNRNTLRKKIRELGVTVYRSPRPV